MYTYETNKYANLALNTGQLINNKNNKKITIPQINNKNNKKNKHTTN